MIPEPAREPAQRRGPHHPVALATSVAFLLLLSWLGDSVTSAWRYERQLVASGQWWRLLTAHLVHLDLHHCLLNVAGLAALWWLYAPDARPRDWLVTALAAALAVGGGLWLFSANVAWYLGLSGVLHGLWAAAAIAAWKRLRAESVLALSLLAVKLALEQAIGPLSTGPGSTLPVVTVAHLYGAIGGTAAGLALRLWREPL